MTSSPKHIERPDLRSQDESSILRSLCHAFGSAQDLEEATESVVRWVRTVLGTPAGVRLALPDKAGRLQVVAAHDERWSDPGNRATRRRQAFLSKTPARVPFGDGRGLVILPMVCRGKPIGTLEVVAPETAVDERWGLLEAVASQTAILFHNLRQREDFNRQILVLRRTAGFARKLVKADKPETAVQAAVNFCSDSLDLPVAAWLAFEDKSKMILTAAQGLGTRKLQSLQIRMSTLPRWENLESIDQTSLIVEFADSTQVERAHAIDAADAVLFIGAPPDELPPSLDAIGALLKDVLEHLASIERRRRDLEIALGRTAHELRGPLLATRNAIELFLRRGSYEARDIDLLEQGRRELDRLSGYVDSLLRWSAGTTTLNRRPAELGALVRSAAEQASLEFADRSVAVKASEPIRVLADEEHLAGAVANVVRNALAYSPHDTVVEVSIALNDGHAEVAIQDDGPGIAPQEREEIFEPFARGNSSGGRDGGSGLGLFITRKAVEAHGGTVSLDQSTPGTTFRIRLPVHPEA